MKFLTIFALTLATASAASLPKDKLKSRNIVVPAGRPEGRIIHGQYAAEGQIPYQVGLALTNYAGESTWCGGSLLNNNKVLTAAHCTDGIVHVAVLLGAKNREQPEIVHEVSGNNIIIHPGWNSQILSNDISIINIPYTAYTRHIQPVKMPSARTAYSSLNGELVTASGWGRFTDAADDLSINLQYTQAYVTPNNVCTAYYNSLLIDPSKVCIDTSGGSSTCQGDSGGPLVLSSTQEQVGLTSFGSSGGCEKGVPAVFTRISSHIDWIRQHAHI